MVDDDYIFEDDLNEKVNFFDEGAIADVKELFEKSKTRVFYGRQIEILFEDKYFHWVTNRALRHLVDQKVIKRAVERLKWGGTIILYWNSSFRYYKTEAKKIIHIVERYSLDKIGSSIGHHCELLVVEGFAKFQYSIAGRNVNEYKGKKWTETSHNLDMIIEKDGIAYGLEVKNTLGYMEIDEFRIKIRLCQFLGVKPVFVARMLPKTYLYELKKQGGFGLLLKYQLYPEFLDDLVNQMKSELGLPVQTPKSLYEGTIQRFENWHLNNVNSI